MKDMTAPRSLYILPVVLALGAACGCGRTPSRRVPTGPPAPPPEPEAVNCVLPEGRSPFFYPRPGDTTVVGYCRRAMQYAKTRHGDYDYFWYHVVYDVLKVERGEWTHKDVRFICCDTWPAPGSGILLKKGAFPFRRGTVYAFSLDTSASPALIVGAEERSRLSPHGPVVRPSLDSTAHAKVTHVAMKFLRSDATPAFSWSRIAEETAHCYVVEFGHWEIAGAQTWNAVVRKDTLQAESLPPPQPARGSVR